jgi:hypothetical protein
MLVNLSSDPNLPLYSDNQIKDRIADVQAALTATLIGAATTDKIANNAFKMAHDPSRLALPELYSKVCGAVFSEVGTGREIGPLRRDLQRFLVEGLATQALARSGAVQEDVRVLTWDILKRLGARFASATSQDEMTRLHLADTAAKIDRILKSVVTNIR